MNGLIWCGRSRARCSDWTIEPVLPEIVATPRVKVYAKPAIVASFGWARPVQAAAITVKPLLVVQDASLARPLRPFAATATGLSGYGERRPVESRYL